MKYNIADELMDRDTAEIGLKYKRGFGVCTTGKGTRGDLVLLYALGLVHLCMDGNDADGAREEIKAAAEIIIDLADVMLDDDVKHVKVDLTELEKETSDE